MSRILEERPPEQQSKIASLRARGVSEHIGLLQLAVFGNDSVRKSSFLPFPRRDGSCTEFAIEMILQHSDHDQTIVTTDLPF